MTGDAYRLDTRTAPVPAADRDRRGAGRPSPRVEADRRSDRRTVLRAAGPRVPVPRGRAQSRPCRVRTPDTRHPRLTVRVITRALSLEGTPKCLSTKE
jgi:hypothetical protein